MCLLSTLYEPTWPISRTFTVTALELNNWGHAKYKTVQLFDYLGIHIINRTSKFYGNLKKIQRMNTWHGFISQVNDILGITGQIIVANIIKISTKGGNPILLLSCHVSNDLLGRGLCSLSAFLFVVAMKEVVKKKDSCLSHDGKMINARDKHRRTTLLWIWTLPLLTTSPPPNPPCWVCLSEIYCVLQKTKDITNKRNTVCGQVYKS